MCAPLLTHATLEHFRDDILMIQRYTNLLLQLLLLVLLLLHPFKDLLSRTTWVSRHQKGKPLWILLEQEN